MLRFLPERLSSIISKTIHPKSIRGQFTLGLTVTLLPFMAISFYIAQEFVRSRVYKLTQQRLQAESELIAYGLGQWGRGIMNEVGAITIIPSLREARSTEIQSLLNTLTSQNPNHLWRFWSASSQNPKLLAFSGSSVTSAKQLKAEEDQVSREYFQLALRGYSSYQVVISGLTSSSCLIVARPVFRSATAQLSSMQISSADSIKSYEEKIRTPLRNDLSGVLVLCMPLTNIANETGLNKLFKDKRLSFSASNNKLGYLKDANGFRRSVILVSNTGQLLFPDVDSRDDKLRTINDLADTKFPALLPIAQRAMRGEELFASIAGQHQQYLVLTAHVDTAWSLILLIDERIATADVIAIRGVQALVDMLTLLIIFILIAYQARALSGPLSVVSKALQQLRNGNFDVQLTSTSDDEIGGLLRNVQLTADRLKTYFKEVTSFAVTRKQLDTAKSIQQDFLLKSIPTCPCFDVEALTRPALEIGADWYDMVDAPDYSVILVADVCDKGVPSALYMSVFRSLIRAELLDHLSELNSSCLASAVIREAIEKTNNYMSSNHNQSMMFATVFIAVVNKTTGIVHYLCAGHESPVLLRSDGIEMLDKVSGPAIGLFNKASYSIFTTTLKPGDYLVAYSDGLIDARNHVNEAWGQQRLRDLLLGENVDSSSKLINSIVTAVDRHMGETEPFDDLTLMVLRWLGT